VEKLNAGLELNCSNTMWTIGFNFLLMAAGYPIGKKNFK